MVTVRTNLDRPPPTASLDSVPRMQLASVQRDQLGHLAELSYPFKACGVLLGQTVESLVSVERVLHLRNLNLGGRDRHVLAPDDFRAASCVARAQGLEIVGFWHSRPGAVAEPSEADLETARDGDTCLVVSVTAVGDTALKAWRFSAGTLQEIDLID